MEKSGKQINRSSLKLVGQITNDSKKTVQYYVADLHLIDELMNMVGSGKLSLICGVELYSLDKVEQSKVSTVLKQIKRAIKVSVAKELKRHASVGVLIDEIIKEVLLSSGS